MPLSLFIYFPKFVVLVSFATDIFNIYEAKVNIKVSFFDISATIFNIIYLKINMFLAWIGIFNMPYYYIITTIVQNYDNCMLSLT
jgi:hypothetical protein